MENINRGEQRIYDAMMRALAISKIVRKTLEKEVNIEVLNNKYSITLFAELANYGEYSTKESSSEISITRVTDNKNINFTNEHSEYQGYNGKNTFSIEENDVNGVRIIKECSDGRELSQPYFNFYIKDATIYKKDDHGRQRVIYQFQQYDKANEMVVTEDGAKIAYKGGNCFFVKDSQSELIPFSEVESDLKESLNKLEKLISTYEKTSSINPKSVLHKSNLEKERQAIKLECANLEERKKDIKFVVDNLFIDLEKWSNFTEEELVAIADEIDRFLEEKKSALIDFIIENPSTPLTEEEQKSLLKIF